MATREYRRGDEEDCMDDYLSEIQTLGNAMVRSLSKAADSLKKIRDDTRVWGQHIEDKTRPTPPPRTRSMSTVYPEPVRLFEMHNPLDVFTADKTWTSEEVYLQNGSFGYNVQFQLCKSNDVANAISVRVVLCCGPRDNWMTWPILKTFVQVSATVSKPSLSTL